MPTGRTLDIATLVTWLAAEALGAFMVRSWVAGGGARAARQRPPGADVMSLPVLVAHAGLNVLALLCWMIFVVAHAKPAAWLALVLLAPAIGLGISTVTIWTPYPGPRPQRRRAESQRQAPAGAGGLPARGPGVLPDHEVKRALEDEARSRKLVDELLARNLAPQPARTVGWNLRPLIPAGHGILAIATFVLAVLAVIAAA